MTSLSSSSSSSSVSSSSFDTGNAESTKERTKLVFLTYDELPDGDPDDLKVLARVRELGVETGVLDWRKVDLGSALVTDNKSAKKIGKSLAEQAGEKIESESIKETAREIDSSSKRRTVYVLRSTWNYHLYYEQFHDFLEHFLDTDLLINDAQLVLWNTDKCYLQDLAAYGISVVPTLIYSSCQFPRRWILESGAFRIGTSSKVGASAESGLSVNSGTPNTPVNSGTLADSRASVNSVTSGAPGVPCASVNFDTSADSCSSINSRTEARAAFSSLEFPCSFEEFTERIKTLGWLHIVVKPAIGLSSYGVKRFQLDNSETAQQEFERAYQHAQECAQKSPVLVQPYLASVATLGERCLVFIDGKFSHAIMKKPFQHMAVAGDAGETKYEASVAEIEFASRVLAQLPIQPLYARVDIVPKEQEPAPLGPVQKAKTALPGPEHAPNHTTKHAVSDFYLLELELVEPSLYFCFKEEAVNRFAEALRRDAVRHEKVAFLKQTFQFLDKPPT